MYDISYLREPKSFTCLASIRACEWLLDHHANAFPLHLELCERAGWDISAADGSVVAEVFAAVDPNNNRKLKRDVERLAEHDAPYRYVFVLSPAKKRTETPQPAAGCPAVGVVWRGWPS